MSSIHVVRITAAVEKFTHANEQLVTMLERLADATRTPKSGGWTPAQIGWHVADTNTYAAALLRGTVPGARLSLAFIEDPAVFTKIPLRVEIPIPELYPPIDVTGGAAVQRLRASATDIVRAMRGLNADRARTYTVQLPFGVITLYQLTEFVGAHVVRHQAQLIRASEESVVGTGS